MKFCDIMCNQRRSGSVQRGKEGTAGKSRRGIIGESIRYVVLLPEAKGVD